MAKKRTKTTRSSTPKTAEKSDKSEKVVAENRKARHTYELVERLEAGLVLVGTEVKSARAGGVNLKDSYASVRNGELFLMQVHINPYSHGTHENHEALRPRKLLLSKRELRRWIGKINERGFTIVPVRMYFKKGKLKVEIALARGKRQYDRRAAAKERDIERDVQAALKERNR
ncbi:MAG: SsrA-binding protein SmpB [Acidobacteriota bacterium]|nr:MAG: SsrA-binding protein SmpB [Acidobacteriota bacterium]